MTNQPIASDLSYAVWQKQQAERTPKPDVSRENRDKFPPVGKRQPKPAWFSDFSGRITRVSGGSITRASALARVVKP